MTDKLSPRMVHIIEALAADWRRLDQRIEVVSSEIEAVAEEDSACERLITVPGIGPIISSATVAAIGTGDVFSRDATSAPGSDWFPSKCQPVVGRSSTEFQARQSIFSGPVRAGGTCCPAEAQQLAGHRLKRWIEAAAKRLHPNKLAIANKLARIAWGVLHYGRDFEARNDVPNASQSA